MGQAVYLDYAATTPVDARVWERMAASRGVYGNPSSIHSFGREARKEVAAARAQVAALLGAAPEEIFFTGGGSEGNNWALKGAAFALRAAGQEPHIVTTGIEHPSVRNACRFLEEQGFAVTYLPVSAEGLVSPDAVAAAVTVRTGIISVMAANNEAGAIEPVAAIGALARERGIFFHVDAVQAAGHIPLDVNALAADALSLSGHKLYAPKGTGALYLRRGRRLAPLLHGGAQERGQRAGTEDVLGIIGLGMAAEIAAQEMAAESDRLRRLQRQLIAGIRAIGGRINGPAAETQRLPGTVNFAIAGVRQDTLLIRLDLAGFAVSGGSACSAGAVEPSHVLKAMGQTDEEAGSAVRVSMGRFTSEAEVMAFLAALADIVHDLRGRQRDG